MNATLYLGETELEAVVRSVGIDQLMDELIHRLRQAFIDFDPVKYQVPCREGFCYSQPRTGLLEWMPILETKSQMLMKVVGYHPNNPELVGLPTILSNFSLYDAATGKLVAILDGTLLTALRTGAASAVASQLLAKPGSTRVGIIGCGAQAITQLHALSRVFDIRRVRYRDCDPSTTSSFRARCGFLDDSIEFVDSSSREVVSDSDLICVATSIPAGKGPVFEDVATLPHLHINAVGSDFPEKTELPLDLLFRSYVTPDCREQAIKEGECQQLSNDQVGKTLSELLREGVSSELTDSSTVFDSTGWALEDYVVTQLFLQHANRLEIGQSLPRSSQNGDSKNPYRSLGATNSTTGNSMEAIRLASR